MTQNTDNICPVVVTYVPTVLTSLQEICDRLKVGDKIVKAWVSRGAPIAVEGEGAKARYSAELAALQAWRASAATADAK